MRAAEAMHRECLAEMGTERRASLVRQILWSACCARVRQEEPRQRLDNDLEVAIEHKRGVAQTHQNQPWGALHDTTGEGAGGNRVAEGGRC